MNVLIQKLHLEGNLDGQNALKVYLHDFFFSRYQRKWEQSYRKNGRFVKCNSSCMGCITVFHQEVANNEHGVGPRIVAMQDPRGGGSGSDTDDAFSLSFEYLNAKSSSDNILTLSVFNNFFTRATLSSVFKVEGRPERSASSTSSLPSRKTLCRSNAVDLLVALLP